MSGVLYKRSPPPWVPEDDPHRRLPTSPSYECPEDASHTRSETMADNIPDEHGLNTHFSDDNGRDTRTNRVLDNFDSYNHNCSFSKEEMESQTNEYAMAALNHYNGQEKNMIKYELIKAITSCAIRDVSGFYGHVNFIAKSTLENSKEELFFAELCHDRDHGIYIPTRIISLEGKEKIGGLWGIKGNDGYYGKEIPVDTLNSHFSDDDVRNIPTYRVADDFDSLYNDDCSFSKEDMERQTNEYATAALNHYNGQEKNMIKYELIKSITSSAIMDVRGFYGHVNFTAKRTLENSKEEFFFAELCHDRDHGIYIPTCIVSLEGKERVGGVRGIKGNDGYYGEEIRVDTQYCYACHEELKHPENGTLYETGHQVDDCYGYSCS